MASTPTRIGQVNAAGDNQALFLKVFGGEVLAAFATRTVTLDKHMVRNIESGKSAQFPRLGKNSASYHTPGTQLTGKAINNAEVVIPVDDMLISDVAIANIDEAMSHYDVRSQYAFECADALAQQFDKTVMQVGLNAARTGSNQVTGLPGGTIITSANAKTVGADLATSFFDAAQALDENDVPEQDKRYGFLRPAQYYLLARTTDVINKDWDGRGSYADGSVIRVAGVELVKTNNLPITNVTSQFRADYDVNASTTAALIMHESAVGTVKLIDLAVESTGHRVDYQDTLLVAKQALGHGKVRVEAAVEVRTGTPV